MESFSEISVVTGFIYRRARGGPPIKRTFKIPDVVEESNIAMFAHDTRSLERGQQGHPTTIFGKLSVRKTI